MSEERKEVAVVIDETGRPKGYLTATEFAYKHYVSESGVRQMIRRGRIKPLKIGRRSYILEDTPYPDPLPRGPQPVLQNSEEKD